MSRRVVEPTGTEILALMGSNQALAISEDQPFSLISRNTSVISLDDLTDSFLASAASNVLKWRPTCPLCGHPLDVSCDRRH
jgi:hypothetical protein